MKVGEAISTALAGLAPVYPNVAPKEAKAPLFTYARAEHTASYTLSGVREPIPMRYNVIAWSHDFDESEALAGQAVDALEAYTSATLLRFFYQSSVGVFDEDAELHGTRVQILAVTTEV